MNEDEMIEKIKTLIVGFRDASGTEFETKSNAINELQKILNADDNKLPVIICTNCRLITRSVFEFTEHYENDITGQCDDVHY